MQQFVQDLMQYPFLQYAVLAGILASAACGVVGSFVVVRRSTYLVGAIAHCVLGGMGLARYLQRVQGVEWMTPIRGATAAAVVAAVVIWGVTRRGAQRMDTVLSAVWALGMAMGISFIMATPGYSEDLMSYLFGNILMVAVGDLWLMVALDVVVIVVMLVCYEKFLAIGFNEQAARVKGLRVDVYEMVFLVLTALTVVLLVKVVGIVMVIALLTLPVATAGYFAGRLSGLIALSSLLSLFFIIGGLALSYEPEWPAGATIIELAGVTYLLTALGFKVARRIRRAGGWGE